ncbi:hypothetical protein [Flavobacterium piscis]|uniref:Uncharacterized protein n=1 Tax=Flavobacterium piscis TaxID=1114874 RepID=A0ABU1YD16_9FLAO|nr:hypothetical protein [Flavobacterium piscis]MDR7212129.1 hypothetical protein [Flavobacterium piscis]
MKKGTKIKRSNDFWYYYEDGEYGNWYFEYDRAIDYSDYYDYYIDCFIKLSQKYGILIPFITFKIKEFSVQSIKEYVKEKEQKGQFGLIYLYAASYNDTIDSTLVLFPSNLYVFENNSIILKTITSLGNINAIENMECEGNPVVKLLGTGQRSKANLPDTHIALRTDAFFELLNSNTIENEDLYAQEDLIKFKDACANGIDNSELAYLNTPRFNSFLRDIKKLNKFCGRKLKFEGSDENVNDNGILLDEQIIYYEDIYKSLPDPYKYKKFEEIVVKIDDINYKKFIESEM